MDRQTWAQISVTVPAGAADAVSDFLAGLSGRGVGLEETGGDVRITGYFDPDSEEWGIRLQRYLDDLAEMGVVNGSTRPEILLVPDEDWMALFRSQHTTVRISDRLAVRPTWCEPGAGREIVLDPGLAFGTGSHATTRMCLQLLDRLSAETVPARVLDLGTGTGVLAIAAAFLGASEVLAVDNDPVAVQVAGGNARNNGVEGVVEVSEGSIDGLAGTFDLILANLSGSLLRTLAPALAAALVPSGRLIVSGVTVEEQEGVREAFAATGLEFRDVLTEDVWMAASLTRRGEGKGR